VVVSVSLCLCGVYVGVVMATLSPIPSRLKMYYKRTRVTSTSASIIVRHNVRQISTTEKVDKNVETSIL